MFWAALAGIVWIDVLLSGDNAVVIALVARQLPEEQQKWGIIGGTVAAIVLRVVMALFAAFLLGVPGLSLFGGVYLVWVAIQLLLGDDDGDGETKACVSVYAAIGTIAAADATMSLDNVMAVAALANGHMGLMVIGVLISIPMVIAGAAIISKIIERFPVLTWAGAALLGWVAGGIIASDPFVAPFVNHYVASVLAMVAVLAVGLRAWATTSIEEAIAYVAANGRS
ncbi:MULTISPECIES: YjbE family putative metal transport protein [unclassified Bradyrhizobium]|uniref:YjbE family putative metal transport protein n=1 Tax=unclassified Bradyrhizobium TaxID=2631580 RepID=UPI002915FA8B|nr:MULTISPECIES: YjbE family putative metal transport protein [unclassified Bradyrhizobium]